MNILIFVLMFIGVVFVVIGYIRATQHCAPRKIEYRFVPRTFVEDAKSPVPVTDIFAKMFYAKQPFIAHEASKLLGPPNEQQHSINKFFISAA